ncbi:unnamed protein product, partial [Iphiclides podalirius]
MRNELKEVRDNVSILRDTILACSKNLEEIDTRVTKLENRMEEQVHKCEFKELEETIGELRIQLNERDQDLLANDFEISGIPEQKGENAINTVLLCAKKLGLDVDQRKMVHAERVGNLRKAINSSQEGVPVGPRRIVVRMSRRALRDEFIRSARVRRTLTTESLGLPAQALAVVQFSVLVSRFFRTSVRNSGGGGVFIAADANMRFNVLVA